MPSFVRKLESSTRNKYNYFGLKTITSISKAVELPRLLRIKSNTKPRPKLCTQLLSRLSIPLARGKDVPRGATRQPPQLCGLGSQPCSLLQPVSVCLSISTGVWMGSEGGAGRAALIVMVLYHLVCSSLLPLLAVYEFCMQFSNKKQRKLQPGKHHIVHKNRAYTIFNYTRVSMQLT